MKIKIRFAVLAESYSPGDHQPMVLAQDNIQFYEEDRDWNVFPEVYEVDVKVPWEDTV